MSVFPESIASRYLDSWRIEVPPPKIGTDFDDDYEDDDDYDDDEDGIKSTVESNCPTVTIDLIYIYRAIR